MDDLISRQAAIDGKILIQRANGVEIYTDEAVPVEYLKNIPAVDVVPVVRCRDCKFRENDDFCTGRGFPYQLVPDDGFCDKGERKE